MNFLRNFESVNKKLSAVNSNSPFVEKMSTFKFGLALFIAMCAFVNCLDVDDDSMQRLIARQFANGKYPQALLLHPVMHRFRRFSYVNVSSIIQV